MRIRNTFVRLMNESTEGEAGGGEAKQNEQATSRLSAMDAIADRNLAEVQTDLEAQGMTLYRPSKEPTEGSPEKTETTEVTDAAETATTDDQISIQLGADPVPIESLDKVQIRMTIDGKEQVKTMEEWRRDVQMDGAARSRLGQATELLAAAKAAAATPTTIAATPAPPAGSDAKDAKSDSPSVAAKAQQIVDALMGGNDADAVKALTEFMSEGRPAQSPATPKAEDLLATLVPAVKQQLSQESALKEFAAANKDIVADPYLAEVADRQLAAVLQKEPNMPFAEALTAAATETRAWMQRVGMKAATEPAKEPIQSRKLEKQKSEIDTVSGLSTKATTVEQPEPSASDVIAEMRKSRLAA